MAVSLFLKDRGWTLERGLEIAKYPNCCAFVKSPSLVCGCLHVWGAGAGAGGAHRLLSSSAALAAPSCSPQLWDTPSAMALLAARGSQGILC